MKLKGKFIGVNANIKEEKHKINNLTLHLKELEKEEQIRPTA
jgi:cell division protein FtsL